MIRIEIFNADSKEISGTSTKTGRPYCFYVQEAYAYLPSKKYPEAFKLSFDKKEQTLPVGFYTLSPDSLYIDQRGNLSIKPVLTPEKQQAAAVQSKPAA